MSGSVTEVGTSKHRREMEGQGPSEDTGDVRQKTRAQQCDQCCRGGWNGRKENGPLEWGFRGSRGGKGDLKDAGRWGD